MKINKFLFLSLAMALQVGAETNRPMSLLSDNVGKGVGTPLFAKDVPRISTGATYAFVEDGEFATCKGSLTTASQQGGVKILFDGLEWWKSQTFGDWDGGSWVTVIVDLKRPYLIGKVDIRALREATRDTKQTFILFSTDGKTFTQHGIAENTTAVPEAKGTFVEHQAIFEKPVLARYAQIRIQKARHQQQISEIAIWGWGITDNPAVKYIDAGEKPSVSFKVRPIQDGAALVSWADFAEKNKGVTAWRIYSSKQPFSRADEKGVVLHKQVSAKQTTAAVYPFEPGSTVYFGMTDVYAEGENATVVSIPVRFNTPYERRTFGDMLAINHFIGGGVSSRGSSWADVSLDMLAQTPFRESRWWFMFPETVTKFLERGIGMVCWPLLSKEAIKNNIKNANAFGLYSFTKGNEPELNGVKPEVYLQGLKEERAEAKKASSWNTIGAPTCNIWPTALDWLEDFYRLGSKDDFDVLDLHTYTTPPEDLFGRIKTVREIMARYGDENKPIISTEFGYADTPEGPEGVSPLKKAQFLVRGLVIHYVLGFRRVYVYSFVDVGTDPHDNEHHFGLLDFDLQKKPAYYAVCNLGKQLGDCDLSGPLTGASVPTYGYQFKSAQNGDYVAVIWNGEQEQVGTFSTTSAEVQVVDMFGNTRRIILDADKRFSLPYGASPIFIRSDSPTTLLASEASSRAPRSADDESKITFTLAQQNLVVREDVKQTNLGISVVNGTDQAMSGSLTVRNAGGDILGTQEIQVAAHAEFVGALAFNLNIPADTALVGCKVFLNYKSGGASFSDEGAITVRRLTAIPVEGVATVKVKFQGYTNDVYVIANDKIEMSFDPQQGGRVLEFLDRKTLTNQIRMDYDQIPRLTSIAHSYGIWFQINKKLRDTPWAVVSAEAGKLVLQAEGTEATPRTTLSWSVVQGTPRVRLDIAVKNKTSRQAEVKFHMHPEYNLAGRGESGNDILLFPTEKGVFKIPFWIDLGERVAPTPTENWWAVVDTAAKMEMRQDRSAGWETPRLWFGGGFYNVEISRLFSLPPNGEETAWLSWALEQTKSNP